MLVQSAQFGAAVTVTGGAVTVTTCTTVEYTVSAGGQVPCATPNVVEADGVVTAMAETDSGGVLDVGVVLTGRIVIVSDSVVVKQVVYVVTVR